MIEIRTNKKNLMAHAYLFCVIANRSLKELKQPKSVEVHKFNRRSLAHEYILIYNSYNSCMAERGHQIPALVIGRI